jgi:hypothetical protein
MRVGRRSRPRRMCAELEQHLNRKGRAIIPWMGTTYVCAVGQHILLREIQNSIGYPDYRTSFPASARVSASAGLARVSASATCGKSASIATVPEFTFFHVP